jgi:cysteine desulfurase
MINLDHVVAPRPRPEAVAAMRPFLELRFGDPRSRHTAGRGPREAVRNARSALAALARCRPTEVAFTSGAAEAASLAVKGFFSAPGRRPARAIVTAIESPTILEPLRRLARSGIETTILPVDSAGLLDPDELRRALDRDAALVAVQAANAEIGTTQELRPLIDIAHQRQATFLADGSASAGLLPLPWEDGGADLVTLSSSSMGGPAGVGALLVREGVRLTPLIEGGVEEEGLRAELPATGLIAGFGAAAQLLPSQREETARRLAQLADRLTSDLRERAGARLTGHPVRRLPGHVSVTIPGVEGEALLLALDRHGICASTGSACADDAGKPSSTLRAIGLSDEEARSVVVFSLGWDSPSADLDVLMDVLPGELARLRAMSGSI